jgi:PAS domain S-box-containing protein
MKKSLSKQIAVVFAVALPVLFGIGVLQYQSMLGLIGAYNQVVRTNKTLEELQATRSMMDDVEAGGSHVAADQRSYAEAYRAADVEARVRLQKLRDLTSDDPLEQKKLDALEPLLAKRLSLQKADSRRTDKGSSEAGALAPPDTSRKLAGDIRAAVSGLEADQQRLLGLRDGSVRAAAARARAITTFGSGLALCLVTLACLLLRYYIARSKRSEVSNVFSGRLLESMASGVCLSDEEGIVLYSNPAGEAMFGYRAGELIGRPLPVLGAKYPAQENPAAFSEIYQQLIDYGTWSGEFEAVRKDGTPFTCYARVSILEVPGRQYWLSVQEDVTERKQAEEKLAGAAHGSEANLRAMRA